MKRFLMIMIAMMVALSFVVPIYAFELITSSTGTTFGGATFKPSNNVAVAPKSKDTEYVATSAHQSAATSAGFEYGIESGSSVMKRKGWVSEVWGTDWPLQSGETTSLPNTFTAQ
jgi:uncharacterized ion transporter superfamily protein YfcC